MSTYRKTIDDWEHGAPKFRASQTDLGKKLDFPPAFRAQAPRRNPVEGATRSDGRFSDAAYGPKHDAYLDRAPPAAHPAKPTPLGPTVGHGTMTSWRWQKSKGRYTQRSSQTLRITP